MLGVVLLLVLFATACVPVPTGKSWASITLVELNGEQNLLLAFNERMVMVNPRTGLPTQLLTSEGTVRRDPETNAPLIWQVVSGQTNGPTAQTGLVEFYTDSITLDADRLLTVSYGSRLYITDLPSARVQSPIGGVQIVPHLEIAQNTGHIIADPILSGNLLYVAFTEQNLVALDVNDDFAEVHLFQTEQGIWATPLLVEATNTLYVPTMDHHLYALDTETFDLRWELDLGGAVAGTPAYRDGYLFVGSFDRKLFIIRTPDAADGGDAGEIVAQYDTENWVWGSPVLNDDGVLYVADLSGYVYALRVEYPGSRFGADDSVPVGSTAQLTELWKVKTAERAIRAAPLVTAEYVIVASRDHRVYWLDRASGVIVYQQELSSEIMADLLLISTEATAGTGQAQTDTAAPEATAEATSEPGAETTPEARQADSETGLEAEAPEIPQQAVLNPYANVTDGQVIVSTMAFNQLLVSFDLATGELNWQYGW